jgi:hypothetical protein
MTMPMGREEVSLFEVVPEGDLRRALTTSFTPRLRVRWEAAGEREKAKGLVMACGRVGRK